MIKKSYSLLLFLLSALYINAQTIVVIDSEDSRVIKDVAVFNDNKTKFGYTSLAGEFKINAFDDTDFLNFQHPSYENIRLTKKEVEENDFTVMLVYKTFKIDEFIISANRWEQNKEEVPNKITLIRKPSIDFANPQTTADLLETSGEVFIQKSQLGGGSPMIRGFSTHRVLIVVDGVRMNNAIFREGNVQNVISLDPNIIETAEVIFGPGAVVYGSDAIGGVMDFHTKRALLSTSEKINVKVNALARTSSANSEKTGHIDFNIGGIKVAFLSSITFSSFGDLRMGSVNHPEYTRPEYVKRIDGNDSIKTNPDPNIQVPTGYAQYNFTEKLRFQPTDKLNITLSSQISNTSDIPRYDRLIQYKDGDLKYGDWYYGPQKWMMNNVSVEWKPENILFDAVKMVTARQDFTESRHDRKLYGTYLREKYEKVVAWSANIDFNKSIGNNLLYYGIEAVRNNISSTAEGWELVLNQTMSEAPRYPDGENIYTNLAAYAGFKIDLSGSLILNSGIRYNYNALYSTFLDNSFYNLPFTEIDQKNDAITGSVGLVLSPGDETQLSMNLSSGFRAPNLDDIGKVFDSEPGNVIVPNPDLQAEKAYNIDLGINQNIFNLLHFEITGFFTLLDNAMVRRDFHFNGKDSIIYADELSQVFSIVNAGNAIVYGTQIAIQMSPVRNFRIKSNINYTKGEDQDGIPLRHVSPLYGSTHFIFESKKFKADLYALYNGELPSNQMSPSELNKAFMYATDISGNPYSPSWYTINLKTSYQLGNFGMLNVGIENIFDHRYRPYSSGIVSPGRNIIIALRVVI